MLDVRRRGAVDWNNTHSFDRGLLDTNSDQYTWPTWIFVTSFPSHFTKILQPYRKKIFPIFYEDNCMPFRYKCLCKRLDTIWQKIFRARGSSKRKYLFRDLLDRVSGSPYVGLLIASRIYRVIQEEYARLREIIVCVILSKKVHMNMGPILNGYGVMTAWNLEQKVMIIDNKLNKIINQHNTWYI